MVTPEAEFWALIGARELHDEGDVEAAIAEISARLSAVAPACLQRFAGQLEERLYILDRREFAEIPVELSDGRILPQTNDYFLYARCTCVLAGERAYADVITGSASFDQYVKPPVQAEDLLYVASDEYERRTGERLLLGQRYSLEAMSNRSGWE